MSKEEGSGKGGLKVLSTKRQILEMSRERSEENKRHLFVNQINAWMRKTCQSDMEMNLCLSLKLQPAHHFILKGLALNTDPQQVHTVWALPDKDKWNSLWIIVSTWERNSLSLILSRATLHTPGTATQKDFSQLLCAWWCSLELKANPETAWCRLEGKLWFMCKGNTFQGRGK